VQLHAGFTFDDAAAIVPYLARLGVSHLYCSPVLQAAPGSTHGYDVVDHQRLSDDLGGLSGWRRLTRVLAEHDLSVVLDIVPNHMALAGAANRWWWRVLEEGPACRDARYFDIDWDSGTSASVLAPVLGDHYGRVLEAGDLHLARAGGSFTVRYVDHELPLSLRSLSDLVARAAERAGSDELAGLAREVAELPPPGAAATDADTARRDELRLRLRTLTAAAPDVADALDEELAAAEGDADALDAILAQQAYRLAHWRTASEELDYRRFFDITTLVGLRAEDPRVFEDTHRLLLDLVAEGDVTGLRVDHVDGLRDPAGYLERLAAAAPGASVVVEKILAVDEHLPDTWPVAGTSGYDFLNRVGDLFVDPGGLAALHDELSRLTGDDRGFDEVAVEAKTQVMDHELAAETERLTELLVRVCEPRRRHRDHTRRDLRTALREVAASMRVYRTYVAPGTATTPTDRGRIAEAIEAVRDHRPDVDGELLDLLERVLTLDETGELEQELAVRFQQLSAPVMAKGVEDTAFYRFPRLLSANEVGGDPGQSGRGVEPFHAHNRHVAARWPATMLTLSTHDTKRSADVRARLSLLSEIPDAWTDAVQRWRAHNERHRRDGWPDPVTELVLYQSLVGAWPIEPDRLEATMLKSINEAKVHTSWGQRDEAYERSVIGFVRAVTEDQAFLDLVQGFLAAHDLLRLGRLTSLSQVALLLTAPGVPDLYQGDDLWDLSLVDPDNRRPVDFEARSKGLAAVEEGDEAPLHPEALEQGLTKLWLIHRLLSHRRRRPDAYEGSYDAVAVAGPAADHVVAFHRPRLAVVVPRLLLRLEQQGWGDTTVQLPTGRWRDVLGGGPARAGGTVPVEELLSDRPAAVLERAEGS
jgi:(1->4)-alpha-D-glucan 1-alpha-D-glucosylmutase